jgi:NNP family nitrate/nitrite transporter-like MFS transporter
MLTAVPLLGGSFFRLVLGYMTGLIGLGLSLIPLVLDRQVANSFGQFLALGVLLRIAGASFAAALPLANGWYPPSSPRCLLPAWRCASDGTPFSDSP